MRDASRTKRRSREIDPEPTKELINEMILQARDHIQALKPVHRVGASLEYHQQAVRDWKIRRRDAAVWLGSSRASWFFNAMGTNQAAALLAMRWPDHAQAILTDAEESNEPLPPDFKAVLQTGVEVLGPEAAQETPPECSCTAREAGTLAAARAWLTHERQRRAWREP